jgi:hypothetical protein
MIRHVTARTLSTLVAGCGVSLFPMMSFGLGLGDIEIVSRLNQPLHARIEIIDVTDEEWQQIRARIAPSTLLTEAAAHPEILASLTLKAVGDARHGHFIEVRSDEALTEPLFDLPVQVSGQSLQVARNYSVLLDPASAEDAPRSQPVPAPALALTQSAKETATPVVNKVDAQARVPHHKGHRARVAHAGAPREVAKVAKAVPTPAVAPAASPAKGVEQQQLESQLASLQETLNRMQATIAAQDAEISKLTAQVAARTNSRPPRPSTPQQSTRLQPSAVADSAADEADTSDVRPSLLQRWRKTLYWIGGIGSGLMILAIAAVAIVRRRDAQALREVARQEATRREGTRQEPKSDPLAWQTNLRAAQSGTWQRPAVVEAPARTPVEVRVEARPGVRVEARSESKPVMPASLPFSTSASEDTVATTVAIEELTQDLQANLEALNASYENEKMESSATGIDAWRVQSEMLERDFLGETEKLPLAVEKTEFDLPDDGTGAASSSRNREAVEILEQSLDFAPDRVDIQLKLLELYHQEALGNRDNFDALLRKLAVDTRQLSPAQQLHIEMLQRSLRDGKQQDRDSDFVAEVAM